MNTETSYSNTPTLSVNWIVRTALAFPFAAAISQDCIKILGSFGGGMAQMAETCGAVTGAFMVIGLKHGKTEAKDDKAKRKGRMALLKNFVRNLKHEIKA